MKQVRSRACFVSFNSTAPLRRCEHQKFACLSARTARAAKFPQVGFFRTLVNARAFLILPRRWFAGLSGPYITVEMADAIAAIVAHPSSRHLSEMTNLRALRDYFRFVP
jgi:hypothetical protein